MTHRRWKRRSKEPLTYRDALAASVVAAILGGAGWFYWLALPAGDAPVRAQATVIALSTGVQNRADPRPVQAVLSLRLARGTPVTLKRSVKCLPAVSPGDSVALYGTRNRAGGMVWRIEGEPCVEYGRILG